MTHRAQPWVTQSLHILFSRKRPDAEELAARFEDAFEALVREGTVQRWLTEAEVDAHAASP